MREPDETKNLPALVADLRVRGVCGSPKLRHCFTCVSLTPTPQSHAQRPVIAVLASAEREKRSIVEPPYEGHSK